VGRASERVDIEAVVDTFGSRVQAVCTGMCVRGWPSSRAREAAL